MAIKPNTTFNILKVTLVLILAVCSCFAYSQSNNRLGIGMVSSTKIIARNQPHSMLFHWRGGFLNSINFEHEANLLFRFRFDYHKRLLKFRDINFNSAPTCMDCYYIDGIYRNFGLSAGASSPLKGNIIQWAIFAEAQFQYEEYSAEKSSSSYINKHYTTEGNSDYLGLSVGPLLQANFAKSFAFRFEGSLGFGVFRSRNAGGFYGVQDVIALQPQARFVLYKNW
jgi:hypothetical protein